MSDPAILVGQVPLAALVAGTFAALGCSAAEADRIASRLVGANLRGHDSHGVVRVPRYARMLRDGLLVPDVTVEVTGGNGVVQLIDGCYGFGQSVGEQAVDIGIEAASHHGVAVTALRNSGHLGRIGDWAERAAAAGLVSIHMVNVRGSLLVAPFGGIDRRMSTSPFCAGVPGTGDEEPIILDMATSVVAEGKALVALKGGKPLPGDAMVSGAGEVSGDPGHLYGPVAEGDYPDPSRGPGALRAFGEHKGSGLNFLMEVMAGALTGSGCAGALDEPRRRSCNGMFSLYLSPEALVGTDPFLAEVRSYVAFLKSSRPVEPGAEVLIPGEPERRTLEQRSCDGLPLPREVGADLAATARDAGVDRETIEAFERAAA